MRSPLIFAVFGFCSAFASVATGLAQDAAPVDTAALLKELARFKDQQSSQSKQSRLSALQTVNAAAASPEKAAALWEEAVHAVQFSGLPKDGVDFRAWREKEGEALNSPLGRSAARLYFIWLGITIQRDGGVSVKELLPQIFAYIKELLADEAAAVAVDDAVRREKEQASAVAAAGAKKPQAPTVHAKDDKAKKMHDSILRAALGASPVAQWMKISDFINPQGWEKSPGSIDGIYQQIVLPEFRDKKDARALDYWDFKIKRDGEAAERTKLSFEIDKFLSLHRPQLQWKRAEEFHLIGQKNRGIAAMMAVIKANPLHPDTMSWVANLEGILQPVAKPEDVVPAPNTAQ